jgi:hypothetical protein
MQTIWIGTTKAEPGQEGEEEMINSFIDPSNILKVTKKEVELANGNISYQVVVDMKTGSPSSWGFTTEKIRDDLYQQLLAYV